MHPAGTLGAQGRKCLSSGQAEAGKGSFPIQSELQRHRLFGKLVDPAGNNVRSRKFQQRLGDFPAVLKLLARGLYPAASKGLGNPPTE